MDSTAPPVLGAATAAIQETVPVEPLYTPPDPENTRTFKFLNRVNTTRSLNLSSYSDLYNWSTSRIDEFWSDVWDETEVLGTKGSHVVDTAALPPANPAWFVEAKLNWAENILHSRSPDKVALIEASASSFTSFIKRSSRI